MTNCLGYNVITWWADTVKNPKDIPDECAGGWQAAENLWIPSRTNVPVAGGQRKISQ